MGVVSCEIDALRQAGAAQFDPVQFHYIEVLHRRAADHPAPVRRILDLKLAQALATFQARFTLAQQEGISNWALAPSTPKPKSGALALLARQATQHASERAGVRPTENAPPHPHTEMKSVTYFRNTWSRLNTSKQVAKAIDQAPRNAGPINSHGLVLKSLALMRDVSPDYLNRFVTYMDALLILHQGNGSKPVRALVKRPAKTRKP